METLASNLHNFSEEPTLATWDDREAFGDIVFFAGVLGLVAGLLGVVRLSGTHFPDALFWRALPLLLTLPPVMFLGVLCAPGGMAEEDRWRAARLGIGGLTSYLAPVLVLSALGALASGR